MTQDTGLLPEMLSGREQFDMVMRGYDRHQVDTYVNHLETVARDLEERLVQAEQVAGQGQREAAEARAILERGRPTFDALGERIATILSLAEEEAEAMRTAAATDAAHIRDQAQRDARRHTAEVEEQTAQRQAAADHELKALLAERDAVVERLAEVRGSLGHLLDR